MTAWLWAFLFTQAVEIPIYSWALRGVLGRGGRVAAAAGASAITHPVVWFVFPWLLENEDYWTMVIAAEIFAVAVEAAWLYAFKLRHALWWSLAANAASLGIGLTSRGSFGWP